MKKTLLALSLGVILVLAAAPAQADPLTSWIGYFTVDYCTGTCGTPPFGEVELTLDGSDVDFMVTLYGGNEFVRTGAGGGMDFLFNGTGISVGDIDGDGLVAGYNAGSFVTGEKGPFNFGVYFEGQGTGGGNSLPGPIEFTVANAAIEDLINLNINGNIFAADIIGQNGNTGLVEVTSEGTPNVPEPGTMVLLGLGLVGMAALRKFKK